MGRLTMLSKASSQSTSLGPNLRPKYLFLGNTSVPKNLRRPCGKSKYMTGFFVSSCASDPCRNNRKLSTAWSSALYPTPLPIELTIQLQEERWVTLLAPSRLPPLEACTAPCWEERPDGDSCTQLIWAIQRHASQKALGWLFFYTAKNLHAI